MREWKAWALTPSGQGRATSGRPVFETRETLNKSGEGISGGCQGILAKIPGLRGRFPRCSGLPFRSSRAFAGFDRPSGRLRARLAPLRPRQPVS